MKKYEIHEKTSPTKGILRADKAPAGYVLKRYYPSDELAPFIEHYWVVRWDLSAGTSYETKILPYPNVNGFIGAHENGISGVVTGTFSKTLSGSGVFIGIKFLPGGFYPFYKKPVEHITNQTIPLKTIFQLARIKKITEQLHEPDEVLISMVEKMLLAKKPEPDGTVAAIGDIVQRAQDDPSIRKVQDIADAFEVSQRTLQYVFKQYVGIGLKWIILRYRLQDVANAIDTGRTDWAVLASEFGFSDQAHLIRDFKKVLGETPAEYSNGR